MNALAKSLIVVSVLLVTGRGMFEYFVVDACFDASNVYNYAQGVCSSEAASLSPVPYFQRFSVWLITGIAGVAVGLVLLNVTGRKAS